MEITKASHRRVVRALLLTVLATGCGSGQDLETPGPVSDEAYIEVMTELMLLDASPPAGSTAEERDAKADSARREILAVHGVTAREILDFAEASGGEAGQMETLWEQITHRYDSARIARLDQETEARSEPEGKLGEGARTAGADSTVEPIGLRDPARTPDGQSPSGRLRSRLQRPQKNTPPARDTTSLPG